MITATKQQEIEMRRNSIVNILCSRQGEAVTINELSKKLGFSKETIRKDLVNVIVPDNDCIKQDLGHGFIYVKPEDKKEERKIKSLDIFNTKKKEAVIEEQPETGKVGPKNHEGYSDPTATKAINSMLGYAFEPGEVWEYSNSDGRCDLFLVLAGFEDFYLGTKLSPSSKGTSKSYIGKVIVDDISYTMDLRRIGVKLGKYNLGKIGEVSDDEIKAIIGKLYGVFGMEETEDPVVAAERWNALNKRELDLDKREKALNAKELIFDPEFEKEKKELLAKSERLEALRKELLDHAEKMGADEQDLKEEERKVLEEKKRLAAWEEELLAKERELESDKVLADFNRPVDDLEYALMKQKIEIYERLIFRKEGFNREKDHC